LVSAIRRGQFRPLNIDSEQLMADPWSSCKTGSSFSKENNLWLSACNMFDEMASNGFDEWRSPNRILEVAIHRVCYPITESVLHQVFSSFGGVVEQILVIGGTDVVLASVVFDSVEVAADVYGELHGPNIYDGCCQMHIKWGLPTPATRGPVKPTSTQSTAAASAPPASMVELTTVPFSAASVAPVTPTSPTVVATTVCPTVADAAAVSDASVAEPMPVSTFSVAPASSVIASTTADPPTGTTNSITPSYFAATASATPSPANATTTVFPIQIQEGGDLEQMKVDEDY
jgi:hypothetical protein